MLLWLQFPLIFSFPLIVGAASPSKASSVHACMQTGCKSWCVEVLKACRTPKHSNLLRRVRGKVGDHSFIHVRLFNSIWTCQCVFQSIVDLCVCALPFHQVNSVSHSKPSVSCIIEKVWYICHLWAFKWSHYLHTKKLFMIKNYRWDPEFHLGTGSCQNLSLPSSSDEWSLGLELFDQKEPVACVLSASQGALDIHWALYIAAVLSKRRCWASPHLKSPVPKACSVKHARHYSLQLKFIQGAGDAVAHLRLHITYESKNCPLGLLASFLLDPWIQLSELGIDPRSPGAIGVPSSVS